MKPHTLTIHPEDEKVYTRSELKQALWDLNCSLIDSYSIMDEETFEKWFNSNYPK